MSIRRKLFLAFIAAAALPLAAVGVLAQRYLVRARVDVQERFVDGAKQAARQMSDHSRARATELKAAVHKLAASLLSGPPQPPMPPELKVLPPDWSNDDAAKLLDELKKNHLMSEKAAAAAKKQVYAHMESPDNEELLLDLGAIECFRNDHPTALGIKVVLDYQVLHNDLPHDFDYPAQAVVEQIEDDNHLAPFFASSAAGHRYIVVMLDAEQSRIIVELEPATMVDPVSFMGSGRLFYVDGDGRAHHTAKQSLTQIPVAQLAHLMPPADETARVVIAEKEWGIYHLPSAYRDYWDFGGEAQLIAVAPEDCIEEPIARFRYEVWAAILVSLLVAVSLSYFLSGRFSESVENLKRGVDALSRGEFERLQKSSGDELGGELVDSMNRMASALAERTRKEEIENWRRLVRVLSHEINNTLGPVKSVATTVRDQISNRVEGETGEDLRSAFRLIVDRVDSLSAFISGYAVLAKLPSPERAPADLNEVVRGATSMLRESAGAIIVEEKLDPAVATPPIDKLQIERVVINLVKNAVEAAAARVMVRSERRGDMVELTVEDDGPGISPEARASLFVPYFSTKPGGSGIGLALARQIVLGHGGSIGTEDRPSGGTLFRVVLPTGASL